MNLVSLLEGLSYCINSLMFELNENPAETEGIDDIIKKISVIKNIIIEYHRGGLSHFNNFLTIKNLFLPKMVTFTDDVILPQKNN